MVTAGIISVVIEGHFGGGDHFDGVDHFGGGTDLSRKIEGDSAPRVNLSRPFLMNVST